MANQRTAGVIQGVNFASGTPAYVSDLGAMPTDPRVTGVIGGATDANFMFFLPMTVLVAAAPSTLSLTNVATAQTGSSGVALTLTAGTGVTSGTLGANSVLYIDGVPNTTNPMLDFTKTVARNIRVNCTGSETGVTFVVRGFDLYGNAQTANITGVSGTFAVSTKAFKSVLSVTPSTGTTSGVTVGTGDVYAFPMRVDNFDEVLVFWKGSLITANTGFVAADTTNPQTATSGEPKGTYATQSASTGTGRLVVYQAPKSLSNATTLFGITPA